jgi:hypothetical protein
MFVREIAVFLGGRRVVLGLVVLAARVVMFGLMMMVCGCVVMTSRGMMMLARRMFCHFSVLQLHRLGSDDDSVLRQSGTSGDWRLRFAHFALPGNPALNACPRPQRGKHRP